MVARPARSSDILARRMAVRPDVPWYWRCLRVAAGGGLLLLCAWAVVFLMGGFGSASDADPAQELARLRESLERQELALSEARARVAQTDRQLQIERAAAADLAKQVKSLAFDNAALKEDLAFFQSLSAAGGQEGAISVNRFRLQPGPLAGEYRYQMLLVRSGQRAGEFRGNLQFVLDVQQDGRKLVLVLPPETERDPKAYQVSFKFFQRVEGTFNLAPGSVLKGMQVRIFENGTRAPRLTQPLNVS